RFGGLPKLDPSNLTYPSSPGLNPIGWSSVDPTSIHLFSEAHALLGNFGSMPGDTCLCGRNDCAARAERCRARDRLRAGGCQDLGGLGGRYYLHVLLRSLRSLDLKKSARGASPFDR